MNRRDLIKGLFIAPAIIRPGLLMPIKPLIIPVLTHYQIVGMAGYLNEEWRPYVYVAQNNRGTQIARVSPFAGKLRIGDAVSVDLYTGEVV